MEWAMLRSLVAVLEGFHKRGNKVHCLDDELLQVGSVTDDVVLQQIEHLILMDVCQSIFGCILV
jgi:hypothetical protein